MINQLTYIPIEDGNSFGTDLFVCTNMLVNTPVTPPSTANTPLASVQAKEWGGSTMKHNSKNCLVGRVTWKSIILTTQ